MYRIWIAKTRHHPKKTLGYKQRCDEKRSKYLQNLTVQTADGKSAVYVDECGFQTESFRPYAYAPKGEPVLGLFSSQRYRKTTMVAARIEDTFDAFSLLEGSCNTECFNAWLEESLCPRLSSKHLVIMDNAPIHRTKRTRELIETTGAELLFLPPYSPDYNPIEHDFANIKRLREDNADMPLNEVINIYQ